MIVLLDNGHGAETPGKRSPDGRHREYAWTRRCARSVKNILENEYGLNALLLVPEDADISLRTRCARANDVCRQHGAKNVLLVSIHNDAAGDGSAWQTRATGMTVRVACNASAASKHLAKCITERVKADGLAGNRYIPTEGYIAQNLAICRDTWCPAVLCECLFQDNRDDVARLADPAVSLVIAKSIADGAAAHIASLKP